MGTALGGCLSLWRWGPDPALDVHMNICTLVYNAFLPHTALEIGAVSMFEILE